MCVSSHGDDLLLAWLPSLTRLVSWFDQTSSTVCVSPHLGGAVFSGAWGGDSTWGVGLGGGAAGGGAASQRGGRGER
jgi:hypothetical protein